MDDNILYVNDETWDWLQEELDKPAEVLPGLKQLMERETPFEHSGEDHQASTE